MFADACTGRWRKCWRLLLLLSLWISTGQAATIPMQPSPAYLASTSLITFAEPDEALVSQITNGAQTIAFSSLMRASTVGDNWASWGSPPDTESATPRVLWSGLDDNFDPVTTVGFFLSQPVSIFGFEAEPGPTNTHTITVSFLMGGVLQQTVTRDVDGNAGALLFAVVADPGTFFDSLTITSDADWAAGQFRYAPSGPAAGVPEPASAALVAAGMALLLTLSKRQRGM
jgi:hypothetical protein